MARFDASRIEEFSNQGNGLDFLTLKDDGDSVQVRFMYEDEGDFEGYTVHKVKVGTGRDAKERYVNCIREEGESISACPLCEDGSYLQGTFFIEIFNEDEAKFQTWQRGKTIYKELMHAWKRVKGDIVGGLFEITRLGKAGDTRTTYRIDLIDEDDTTIDDILQDMGVEEFPAILGSIVLDKNEDEILDYFDTGTFDDDEDDRKPAPKARRGARKKVEEEVAPRRRRTRQAEVEEDEDDFDDEAYDEIEEEEEVEAKPARRRRQTAKDDSEDEAPTRRRRRR